MQVCRGLVEKFNGASLSDERRATLERLLNFTLPSDLVGPQINPISGKWPRYGIESSLVPTALVRRVSRPRSLHKKGENGGKRSSEVEAEGVKRIRTLELFDGARTHLFISGGRAYIVEHE